MDDRRRLLVMRHAHAEPGHPGQADRDRALSPFGTSTAEARAGLVAELSPTDVLCSSALRTVQTLEALRLPDGVRVAVEDGIYEASAQTLVNRLATVPRDARTVLVVGHLPTVGHLVEGLLGDQFVHAFQPGAIAVLEIDCAWAEVTAACADLTAFHD